MTRAEIAFAIVSGLAINEVGEWCPWLARRLVRWSAQVRYRGRLARAAQRAEELTALIDARPGKLFKLITASGFAAAAHPRAVVSVRRRRRPAPGNKSHHLYLDEVSASEAAVVAKYGGARVLALAGPDMLNMYELSREDVLALDEGRAFRFASRTGSRRWLAGRYFVEVEPANQLPSAVGGAPLGTE
jgi:hypothetical protein